jgi:signal transduction histidine kinase
MRPAPLLAVLLLGLAPLGLLTWLGVSLAREEEAAVARRLARVQEEHLQDLTDLVGRHVASVEVALLRGTELPDLQTETLRARLRELPQARQLLVVDANGQRLFPPAASDATARERAFLERTASLWEAGLLVSTPAEAQADRQDHGWHTWYYGPGLQLIFWRRDAAGHLIGVELNRSRLLAELIGVLPDQAQDRDGAAGRISLVDGQGRVLYQWGDLEPEPGSPAAARRALPPPLAAWSLGYHGAPAATGGGVSLFPVLSGLGAVGLVLLGLAVYVYRESSRDLREAAQRVTFVNQVSHELKTPLTNIRMYAELLAGQVPDDEPQLANHLQVIIGESERLSRLIGNVLAFARRERGALRFHPTAGVVDDTIRTVVAQFRPALEPLGVACELDLQAPDPVQHDADLLAQILGNLGSNVEKYAAGGGLLHVESRQQGMQTTIRVADRGPGIPPAAREAIFAPFRRLGGDRAEAVAGTGIGLTISRELARLHGGDLVLEAGTGTGATFRLTLHTPPTEER